MQTIKLLRGQDKLAPFFYGLKDNVKFAGGFIRWMASPSLNPAPPGDIDLWANTDDDVFKAQEYCYTVGKMKRGKGDKLWHDSELALTAQYENGQKIQIIKPKNQGAIVAAGTLQDILNNFDFTIARAGLVDLDTALVDDDFIKDELRKRLVLRTIHCPIGAIKRIAKYNQKGYYISPAELYKLFADWDSRNETYKLGLKEALSLWENTLGETPFDPEANSDFEVLDTSQDVRKTLARLIYVD